MIGQKIGHYEITEKLGQARPLTASVDEESSPSLSPDGRYIAFLRESRDGSISLVVVPPSGGAERILSEANVDELDRNPQTSWSPDGRWIAYPGADSEETRRSIYFVGAAHSERSFGRRPVLSSLPINYAVQFLDFRNGKIREVLRTTAIGFWGLTVTPNGRTLLFSQTDQLEADLMLVENFR